MRGQYYPVYWLFCDSAPPCHLAAWRVRSGLVSPIIGCLGSDVSDRPQEARVAIDGPRAPIIDAKTQSPDRLLSR